MIYPELQGYLMGVLSPDDLAQFDAGFAMLEAFAVDEYMTPFDTIIGEVSNQGDTATVDNVRVTLRAMLVMLVQLHEIQLSEEDFPLSVPIAILEVLQRLQGWEDLVALQQLVRTNQDVGEDRESTFAEVCAYVSGRAAEDFLPHLQHVSDDLIQGLLHLGRPDDEVLSQEVETEIRAYVMDYRRVRERGLCVRLWADWVLMSPMGFGVPFASNLARFVAERSEQLGSCTQPEQYAALAEELLAVAAISHERLAQGLTLIRLHAGELFNDLKQTALLDAAVAKLFLEVSRVAT